MKKILFVLGSMRIGGSVTSLINLLELLQKKGYKIDLFLMEHDGLFLERSKNIATLLEEDFILSCVVGDKRKILRQKNLEKIVVLCFYALLRIVFGSQKARNIIFRWRAKKLSCKYDIIVAYQEGWITDFTKYINAQKKIAWIHTQFDKFACNYKHDELQRIYDYYDNIVCVCNSAKNDILNVLTNIENKMFVIQNVLNIENIINKSKETQFGNLDSSFTLVSVGHFSEWKQFGRAVAVSKRLVEEGYEFRWFIVGDGTLFNNIQAEIKSADLSEIVVLLGAMSNPYPIIKNADFLVITSSYEAHPMVAIEAFVLDTPVISTSFASAHEVIQHEVDGLICENSTDGLYGAIRHVLENKQLRDKLKYGVLNHSFSNDLMLNQLEQLFGLGEGIHG